MKKVFASGLVILLPMTLTIMLVTLFVNILTAPFLSMTQALLEYLSIHEPVLLAVVSRLLILLFLWAFLILVGLFAEHFFIHALVKQTDRLLHRLPLINKLYKVSKEAVHTFFSGKNKENAKIVFAPFFEGKKMSLGFAAPESVTVKGSSLEGEELYSVFLPEAPNPSFGFLLLYKKEQLVFSEMTPADAMKTIVSCGTVFQE